MYHCDQSISDLKATCLRLLFDSPQFLPYPLPEIPKRFVAWLKGRVTNLPADVEAEFVELLRFITGADIDLSMFTTEEEEEEEEEEDS